MVPNFSTLAAWHDAGGGMCEWQVCTCVHTAPLVQVVGMCAFHSHEWSLVCEWGALALEREAPLVRAKSARAQTHIHMNGASQTSALHLRKWSFVHEHKGPKLAQMELARRWLKWSFVCLPVACMPWFLKRPHPGSGPEPRGWGLLF